ncbi:glycosyltransferase [Anoxybacillus sp. UARK-01]|uniref:glycosyltransferase family 2 protein n=1 Tax=Anoxybacillus sp. UARK-01 TaxID=1895648 RepID=UPI0009BC0B0E|nr:glycosyltransferase family 2 protein [Anoxybacillus sp. UARK-01]OQM45359.1 glycosyltransferase [Anoxybacillus sp. UARK-01]
MKFPAISLCMIVKNEEDFIEQCLASVSKLVSEIIIVDTGSTDGTLSICEKFQAKIYHYEWNHHFAEARNFGLLQASGDWILWMDADEQLESNQERLVEQSVVQTNAHVLLFPVLNYYGDHFPIQEDQFFLYYQPRLFRNHMGIRFYNRIHETIQLPEEILSYHTSDIVDAPIHHYGYIKEIAERKNKSSRNKELIMEEINTPHHSPWIEYHLASEYYREKDYSKAFLYVNASILNFLRQQTKPPAIIYRLKYTILLETNSIDGAWPGIEKALQLYPDYVDLHFMKGYILFQKGKYQEALASFEKCLELGECHPNYLILKGTGSFKALKYKELCLNRIIAQSNQ